MVHSKYHDAMTGEPHLLGWDMFGAQPSCKGAEKGSFFSATVYRAPGQWEEQDFISCIGGVLSATKIRLKEFSRTFGLLKNRC